MSGENCSKPETSGHSSFPCRTWKNGSCCTYMRPLLGFGLLFMSAFFFCISNSMVKLTTDIDVFNLAFYRYSILFVLSLPFVVCRQRLFFPKGYRLRLLLRCLFGTGGLLTQFYGLRYMSIADVNMIVAAAPFVTVFLAGCILGEKVTKLDFLNLFVTLAGVMLIVKPPMVFGSAEEYDRDPNYIYGVLSTVGAVFIVGGALVTIRMVKDLPAETVIMNFGFFGALIAATMVLSFTEFHIPQNKNEVFNILTIGITASISQLGLTLGLKIENAAIGGLIRMTSIVILSFVIQIILFENMPGIFSMLGALMITFVILSSGVKKILDSLPDESNFKSKLTFKQKEKENSPIVV